MCIRDSATSLPKVPSEDEVELFWFCTGIIKEMLDGGSGCGRHSGAHIVGILDTQVFDGAEGDGPDVRALVSLA